MTNPFHLSIGVKSIDESVKFFTDVLNGKVTHQEPGYVNVSLFGHQITLKPNKGISPDLPDFHFGFNMSLADFKKISDKVLSTASELVHMEPKVVDGGTSMERKKMYLKCPTGYLVELKGYTSTSKKDFSKEELATHAYEALNMIADDFFTGFFFNKCISYHETSTKKVNKSTKVMVHYNRNRLRIVVSAMHRYIETYREKIKHLDLEKDEAGMLFQKFNGNKASKIRHLSEHQMSSVTQEPHSLEQVDEHLKNFERLMDNDFDKACDSLSRTILRIRDSIAEEYPNCGGGIDRWKLETTPESLKTDFGAATMTVGHLPDPVSSKKE